MTTWLGHLRNWFELNPPLVYWMLGAIVVAYVFYFLSVPIRRAWEGDNLPQPRPIVSLGLSVVVGILILVNGFAITSIRAINFTGPRDLLAIFAAIGYMQSMVVLAAAVMLLAMPRRHGFWGFVVIVFSVASIVVGGGFILGSMLGSIGGALAMTWEPPAGSSVRIAEGTVTQPQMAQASMPYQQVVQPADQPEPPFPGQPPP